MWKNSEPKTSETDPSHSPDKPGEQVHKPAIIGASITIKGDLSGAEDLTIQGCVEGTVDLKKHNLTVGQTGRVKADIFGKTICIEGQVQGNLHGGEKVILHKTGMVEGNIIAPRVNLVEGARFQGSIDMNGGAMPEAAQKASTRGKEEAALQTEGHAGKPPARS